MYIFNYNYETAPCVILQYVLPRSVNDECGINVNYPIFQNVISPAEKLKINYSELTNEFINEPRQMVYETSDFDNFFNMARLKLGE